MTVSRLVHHAVQRLEKATVKSFGTASGKGTNLSILRLKEVTYSA